jgi:transposase
MIALLIERKFAVKFAIKYIPQLLKSIGLSFQKVKFEATQKSPLARNQWLTVTWPKILRKAKCVKEKILFGDEASFAMWGSLSYTWAPRGKQPVVKTKGLRKSVKVFGLIEYGSGRTFYEVIDDKLNSGSYISFLRTVLIATRSHLLLVQDGAKYHHAEEVLNFLAEKSRRITSFKLPAYSPDFNPIEGLWKKVKARGTHLVYFDCFEELIDRVAATMEWFASKPEEVIPLFGKYKIA